MKSTTEENPLDQRERMFNVPTIVVAIIGLFCALHIVRSYLSPQDELWWLLALSVIPVRFEHGGLGLPGGDIAVFTSPITHMFIHGDFLHLTVNSIWALAFGSAVARRIGNAKFLIFSALCGFGGVLAHLLSHWGDATPMLGASAAISGQMAGAMRFFFAGSSKDHLRNLHEDVRSVPRISILEAFQNRRFLLFLGVWIVLNILFGISAGATMGPDQSIAWEAHIGGFLAGLLLFDWFDRQNPVNGLEKQQ